MNKFKSIALLISLTIFLYLPSYAIDVIQMEDDPADAADDLSLRKGFQPDKIIEFTDEDFQDFWQAYTNHYDFKGNDCSSYEGSQFDFEKNDKTKFKEIRTKNVIFYYGSLDSEDQDYDFNKKHLTVKVIPIGFNLDQGRYNVINVEPTFLKISPDEAQELLKGKNRATVKVIGKFSIKPNDTVYQCNDDGQTIHLSEDKFKILKEARPVLALRCKSVKYQCNRIFIKPSRILVTDRQNGNKKYRNY